MKIKKLQENHVNAFWDIRLAALKEDTIAFGASYEEEICVPLDELVSRYQDYISPLEEKFILGAFNENDQLVGTLGFRREKRIRLRHKGSIWGMYVAPNYRGKGISRLLLTDLIKELKMLKGFEQLYLTVVSNNLSAKGLYTSLNFNTYAIEKHALKVNDLYYDEELMVLYL